MGHDYLDKLKQTHPTLRLLAADNAPLILSFLAGSSASQTSARFPSRT